MYVTQIHYNTWFLTSFLLNMPKLMLKRGFLFVSKIHIFFCFLGFWRLNWYSKTSFMIQLTKINAVPVKKTMKTVFLENHVFTRFNLTIIIAVQYIINRKHLKYWYNFIDIHFLTWIWYFVWKRRYILPTSIAADFVHSNEL